MHNAVLVAGMHRSGTSAMTRVLNLLGCALPEDLIAPNLGNEQGHWESFAVVALNDQILAAAGTCWDDWSALNPDWRASPLRDEAIAKASEILRQHGQLSQLFGIKDPRISKLADIWLDACDAAKVDPTLIIMLRNPVEVAASLERRDLMTPAYSHLLWLRHMLDVEFYSRGRKRAVCQFDFLLDNWFAAVEQIKSRTGLFFPRNSPLVQSEIDQFIDTHSRHHSARSETVTDNPGFSVWLRQAYAIFLRWSVEGENPDDRSELDAIRHAFDQSAPAFSRLILPGTQSGIAGAGARLKIQLEEQLEQARVVMDQASRMTEDSQICLAEAQARESTLAAKIEEQSSVATQLETEVNILREEAARVTALALRVEDLQVLEEQLRSQLSDMQHSVDVASQNYNAECEVRTQAEQQLAQARQDILQLKEQLAENNGQMAALSVQSGARSQAAAEMETEIATLRDEVARVTVLAETAQELQSREDRFQSRIAELEAFLEASNQERDVERDAHRQAEQQLARAQEDLSQVRDELADMTNRLSFAESALNQRKEELSQIWKELEAAREIVAEVDSLRDELKVRDEKLVQANDWVFRLAGERQAVEQAAQQAAWQAKNDLAQLKTRRDEEVVAARVARGIAEGQLADQLVEVAKLGQLLQDAISELDTACGQAQAAQQAKDALAALLQQRDAEVGAAEMAKAAAERQLAEHFSEVATLTEYLHEATSERDVVRAQAQVERQAKDDLTALLQRRDENVGVAEMARNMAERQLHVHIAEVARLKETLHTATLELDTNKAQTLAGRQAQDMLAALLQQRDTEVGAAEMAKAAAERQLAEHFSEVATLTEFLHEATSELDMVRAQANAQMQAAQQAEDALATLLQQRDEEIGAIRAACDNADSQLNMRMAEVATLQTLLHKAASETDATKDQTQWLRRLNMVSSGFPRWWSLMPLGWRRKREHARYVRSGLFNAEAYIQLYPDVAESGMDAVKHYVLHGMDENRQRPLT